MLKPKCQLRVLHRLLPGMQPCRSHGIQADCGKEPSMSEVIFTDIEDKGVITINRPKQLNALNESVVKEIYKNLHRWNKSKSLVIVKGTGGKAFCAGGDVVAVTRDKSGASGKSFFKNEYRMNGLIASLKIPYIALIDGIVMGGGVGISLHGTYQVATEKTLFAMPETQIGLFPDVGVSQKLGSLPYSLGYFLGLSGYRLKGYDVKHAKLATHFCHSTKLESLENDILNISPSQTSSSVKNILNKYEEDSINILGSVPKFSLASHLPLIEKCFSANTVEQIFERLENENNEFAQQIIKLLKQMSPTAMKVTVKLIQVNGKLDIFEALNNDFRVACRFAAENEFREGVRALLIDKDKSPQWNPKELKAVSEEKINSYFIPHQDFELGLPKALIHEESSV